MPRREREWDPRLTMAYVDDGGGGPVSAKQEDTITDPVRPTVQETTQGFSYNPYYRSNFSYTPYERSGFSYKDAPEYINRYQQQIDDLSNRILHWQGFNYNVNADPLYQQYAEQYNRNGQNAMRNTLAQVAARTGGMASSYAGTAAQNSYNEYMQGLNDKVPELYQLAYGMYADKLNKQRNDLQMLEALEQGDYAKYIDLLQQYNTDRNLAYNVWDTTESAKERNNELSNSYAYNVWNAQENAKENANDLANSYAYKMWAAEQDAKAAEQNQTKNGGQENSPEADQDDVVSTLRAAVSSETMTNEEALEKAEYAASMGWIDQATLNLLKIEFGAGKAGEDILGGLNTVKDYITQYSRDVKDRQNERNLAENVKKNTPSAILDTNTYGEYDLSEGTPDNPDAYEAYAELAKSNPELARELWQSYRKSYGR